MGRGRSKALTINVFQPLIKGGAYITKVSDQANSWRHSSRAFGGYHDAAFSIRAPLEELEEWLQDGLGRHIEVYDDSLSLVWEGFVNKVTLTSGFISLIRGPLTGVANRVNMRYTKVQDDADSSGKETYTDWIVDTASLAKWGAWSKIYNSGSMEAADAEIVVNTFLKENKEPEVRQDISNASQETNIIVDCYGYAQWLEHVYPRQTLYPRTRGGLTGKVADLVSSHLHPVVFNYIDELSNGGFETAGVGTTFANWSETLPAGASIQRLVGPGAHTGDAYASLTTPAAAYSTTAIYQDVNVWENQYLVLTFFTRGNGSKWGKFSVYDITGGAPGTPIINNTATKIMTNTEWRNVSAPFRVPVGCSAIRVTLYAPDTKGSTAFYDAVSLRYYPQLQSNNLTMPKNTKGDQSAWNALEEAVARGDSSYNRWLFGVYENRTPYYHIAPSEPEYILRFTEPDQRYETMWGERVEDWMIRPGKWLMFPDILVGYSDASDLREDPRMMFIEEVRYSAGWGVTINVGKANLLEQKLAQLGIAGVNS